jgi:hypothetical protein
VDAKVFSAYVHCVNFGAESLNGIVQDMVKEHPCYQEDWVERGRASDNDGSACDDDGGMEDVKMDGDGDGAAPDAEKSNAKNIGSIEDVEKFLIELYLLADKLIDSVSANLAIDELISVIEMRSGYLSAALVHFVYGSTTADSPLRKLVRDHSMIDDATAVNNSYHFQGNEFPHDFLEDVLLEVWAINRHNADAKICKVYCNKELEPHRYHYPVDNTSAGSADSQPAVKEKQ